MFQGRLWEGRALAPRRHASSRSRRARRNSRCALDDRRVKITALDDPRRPSHPARASTTRPAPRPAGDEINAIGNIAEDCGGRASGTGSRRARAGAAATSWTPPTRSSSTPRSPGSRVLRGDGDRRGRRERWSSGWDARGPRRRAEQLRPHGPPGVRAGASWRRRRRVDAGRRAERPQRARTSCPASPSPRSWHATRIGARAARALVASGTRGGPSTPIGSPSEAGIAALDGRPRGGARRVSDGARCVPGARPRLGRGAPRAAGGHHARGATSPRWPSGWRRRATSSPGSAPAPLVQSGLDRGRRAPAVEPRHRQRRRGVAPAGRLRLSRRGRGAPGSRRGPRSSMPAGPRRRATLKITCWAPASESSPNRSTTCCGARRRGPSRLEPHALERRPLDLVGVAADRRAVLAR